MPAADEEKMIADRFPPVTIIVLLVLFAIAIGAVVMQVTGAQIEESPEKQLCDPLTVLKMQYVNKEITAQEFDVMKGKIGAS